MTDRELVVGFGLALTNGVMLVVLSTNGLWSAGHALGLAVIAGALGYDIGRSGARP